VSKLKGNQPMSHSYAKYEDIDKIELQKDIDQVKVTLGSPSWDDFQHLLKLERWGWISNSIGFVLLFALLFTQFYEITLSALTTSLLIISSAFFIAVANVSRWANVAHPILHGAYDKVPNIPLRYTKSGFAQGKRRFIDWLDWITPEAWMFEHNIMHHYHLGEEDDPDNVASNMKRFIALKIPMFIKYIFVYLVAATWKFSYYAPNTLRILENKKRKKEKLNERQHFEYLPTTKNGRILWKDYYLPYATWKFLIIPALFLPLGSSAFFTVMFILILSELIANLHSFTVIVPNHAADDIYQFNEPHKNQGEFYLRQIMGSVNYNTGSDFIDFGHGWLNYQIEHHLFPALPLSQYQKMQPIVKEICKKHNLEYRQESVFKRAKMTVELMVGRSKVLKVDGV
jgi:fatty acid desaturase